MDERDDSVNADAAFARGKRLYLIAVGAIVVGIALVGSLDKKTVDPWISGGALLGGWVAAVLALHRLGRAGSNRTS